MAGIVNVLCSADAVDIFSGDREEWCLDANEQSRWGGYGQIAIETTGRKWVHNVRIARGERW